VSLEILAGVSPGEVRTVLLRDGVLEEAWVERPARPDGVGDLHRARAGKAAPALGGLFVRLAGGEGALLPLGEGERPPSEGEAVAVRVTRAAQGGKGARVTAALDAEDRAFAAAAPEGAPRLLRRGPIAAERLARAHTEAVLRTDGAALAARLRAALGPARVALSAAPVLDSVEAELEALAGPEVALPGGGRLLVHPVPALTAIDLDAGAAAGGRDSAAHARFNAAALAELARQIRLRQLAGPILVDFAGLSLRRRRTLEAPLREALAGDRRARVVGISGLGFAEILRDRVHPPLHEVLGQPPSALTRGLAALRRAAREAAAAPGRRFALVAAPAVLAALRALPGALEEHAAAAGMALDLRPDPALVFGAERIEEVRDGR
jgi:Ribonuclease G/E